MEFYHKFICYLHIHLMHDPHFLRLIERVSEVFCWRDSKYRRTDEVLLPIQMSNILVLRFVFHIMLPCGSFVRSVMGLPVFFSLMAGFKMNSFLKWQSLSISHFMSNMFMCSNINFRWCKNRFNEFWLWWEKNIMFQMISFKFLVHVMFHHCPVLFLSHLRPNWMIVPLQFGHS